jgi:hypothetical protein
MPEYDSNIIGDRKLYQHMSFINTKMPYCNQGCEEGALTTQSGVCLSIELCNTIEGAEGVDTHGDSVIDACQCKD